MIPDCAKHHNVNYLIIIIPPPLPYNLSNLPIAKINSSKFTINNSIAKINSAKFTVFDLLTSKICSAKISSLKVFCRTYFVGQNLLAKADCRYQGRNFLH